MGPLSNSVALSGADRDAAVAAVKAALRVSSSDEDELIGDLVDSALGIAALWRGRRGTEAAIDGHAAGDRFVVIAAHSVAVASVTLAALGATARIMASGVGDVDGAVEADAAVTGLSVLPPAPAHLAMTIGGDGNVTLGWVRRSRIGWRWTDGADVPLGEEREAYRVTLRFADGSDRVEEVSTPGLTIAAADRSGGVIAVEVRQVGTNGLSPPAAITIPAMEA